MSQSAPQETTTNPSSPAGLEPGALTLRQAADALGSSTTTLRKMIRQGRLPEAEKVKTLEGRVWSIPSDAIPGIAARAGFSVSVVEAIDLREPEADLDAHLDIEVDPGIEVLVDPHELANHELGIAASADAEQLDDHRLESWRLEPTPSGTIESDMGTESVVTPISRVDAYDPQPLADSEPETSTALQSIGADVDVEPQTDDSSSGKANQAPTLSEVLDTALLEKLLGAKDAETAALVSAERQRTEYESLAARQLEIEQRYADVDLQRNELSDRLQNESLARAISDARVTELRDQLQREITYAEAERYERRQALARETKATAEAAEIRASLGWWARRKLRRSE